MNIQAEWVTDAVHKVLFERRVVLGLLPDLRALQEAEPEQFLLHELFGLLLPILRQSAWGCRIARRPEHAQNRVIDLLLPTGEPPAHRNGAREVGVVIGVA